MRARALLLAGLGLVAAAALALAAHADDGDPVLDNRAQYPEGPLFAGETLYVAEMGGDRVSAYDAAGRKRTFFRELGCGPTAIAPYGQGYLILCHLAGELIAVDSAGKPLARYGAGVLRDPNDASADAQGGVFFSDPGPFTKDSRPTGYVYRLTPQGQLQRVAEQIWYSNGVYVDRQENALYVSETMARKVWRYPINPNGTLQPRTLFADIEAIDPKPHAAYREAGPDGLERAPNGEMIVAIYGEGRLLRIARDGTLAGMIEVPMPYVTNVAFDSKGQAVLVGATNNIEPPFWGQVRRWSPAKP